MLCPGVWYYGIPFAQLFLSSNVFLPRSPQFFDVAKMAIMHMKI